MVSGALNAPYRVVIVGGGFGGLYAAKALHKSRVQVTVLDRRNYHLFQPLLYQVATGALSPANIAAPLRSILKHQHNVKVLLAEVTDIDVAHGRLVLRDRSIAFDTLILAAGAQTNYFGNNRWIHAAPGLKSVEDATEVRRRILLAFETAERDVHYEDVTSWLTFVIIGGGPTGVELAGAVAEIARNTLKHDFRNINPSDARIILLDGAQRILPAYPPALSLRALASLQRLGVAVRTRTLVTNIEENCVTVQEEGRQEHIRAKTILWTAGVQASTLGKTLAQNTGAKLDRAGRVVVQADLTVPGYANIFVIGDLANFSHQTGQPLPGIAPVAIQQGQYVAELISRRLVGRSLRPFRYRDFGNLATIGRSAAVADFGRWRFSGFVAWLLWLFVHLMYIVGFQNRVLVLIQWAWNYFTRNRSARLITGDREQTD